MTFTLCPACANLCPRDYVEDYHSGISKSLCKKHEGLDIENESNKLSEAMEDLEPFGRNQGRFSNGYN